MYVTSRKTERIVHVTLTVTGHVPDMYPKTGSARYTPDTVTVSYSSKGAGWHVIAISVSGLRTGKMLRTSDAWDANAINGAPGWIRTLAFENTPKDD